MGRFYFVRHGQTVWNVENKICGASDSPLTELGHEQARKTGRILKEKIEMAAKNACAPDDTMGNMPFAVTPEDVVAAMKTTDKIADLALEK